MLSTRAKSIGIIGSGNVGTSIASSLISKNIVNRISMYDVNETMCRGVVRDLEDQAFVTGINVEMSKSMKGISESDIIVVTAGAKQRPNEPRTELVSRNVDIMNTIMGTLELEPRHIMILVSNPVDIITSQVAKMQTCIPKSHIIGSGTYLDSQRLRVEIAKRVKVSVKNVHAYILGEHGDSQVFAKSMADVGGCKLTRLLSDKEIADLELSTRRKAYDIIRDKGATCHGIGACVAEICENIILDKKGIIPASAFIEEYGLYMGWPSVIGASGIERVMPVELNTFEKEALDLSAMAMKSVMDGI
jgi:L-lactate dehydrogenase